MNREIRFRAWISSERRMEYDKFYINQFTGECHYTEPYHYEHEDKVTVYDCGEEEPTLMQFTGLKDKNKKAIYEGDIISVAEIDSSQPAVGKPRISQRFAAAVVTWNNTLLCYMYNPIRKGVNYENYAHQMLGYGYDIEVIGNIYETPELLNPLKH